MIEIFNGQWRLEDISEDKVYIFSDNNAKIGKQGLSIIRDLPNSIGIRVKRGPSKNNVAFYTDEDFASNISNINEDILLIKKASISKTIVFSSFGYGNNIDKLYEKAPKTYEYLTNQLRYHFGFDNKTGKSWSIIPSSSDILNARVISLENSDLIKSMIVSPVGSSSHLYNEPITELIKSGKKVAFTQNIGYQPGDLIIFTKDGENLICQVCASYNLSLIDTKSWCLFECFTGDFLKKNDDIYEMGYIQTHFKYLLSIKDDTLNINNKDYMEEQVKPVKVVKKEPVKPEPVKTEVKSETTKKDNTEVIKLVNEIESLRKQIKELRTPYYKKQLNLLKSWFNKKFSRDSIQELLDKSNLKGDLTEVNNILGLNKHYKLVNKDYTYYIEFKSGKFKNSINILIVFKNEI